ncbi:MAG: type II toxin-antitoxin system VapC family toxin [Rhizobiaceae bacterium]|nr:type II toxin-antitoxin system VapC family toxin [Rhizobiaceae bacterium]MCV0406525.1 type II toxin-antitoxin system VapC family toxin [Rhizobiaceae bacterium]
MFLDASVIVALLIREQGYEDIERLLSEHRAPFHSSAIARYEAAHGIARAIAAGTKPAARPTAAHLKQAAEAVDEMFEDLLVEDVPITPEVGHLALAASAQYGKAVGHAADLNLGDCFAYACAKSRSLRLAYKGNDFIHTDLA